MIGVNNNKRSANSFDLSLFPNVICKEAKGIPIQTKTLQNKLLPARPSLYLKITSAPLIENSFPSKKARIEAQKKFLSQLETSAQYKDFLDAFSKVFEEHIEGFTGLSRRTISSIPNSHNAESKKMEWQTRLEEKQKMMEKSKQKQNIFGSQIVREAIGNDGKKANVKEEKKVSGNKHALATNFSREYAIEKYRELKRAKRESSNQPNSKGHW